MRSWSGSRTSGGAAAAHESSREEGDDDHGRPARHQVHGPHAVCQWHVRASGCQQSIEGVEVSLIWSLGKVCLLGADVDDIGRRGVGTVQ